MIVINDEVLDISNDVIESILEVGTVVTLKEVIVPTDSTQNNSAKDLYASYYGQTKDANPVTGNEIELNAILSYNPSTDRLKSSGLDESCSVLVMFATYELIQKGFIDKENDRFNDIITNLKRNKVIDINGASFLVSNVGMTANLNGFSIVCNLACDIYE